MTRIGDRSKMIIMGDTKQIDLNKKSSSSLARIVRMFADVSDIGVVEFERADIVRNPLIIKIDEIFDIEEEKGNS
jgi:phosphate starvation-inducible PhoH-like protein